MPPRDRYPRTTVELEQALLGLDHVRGVEVASDPFPRVEALYVEAAPGRSTRRTIQEVVTAARDTAGVEILSARVHVVRSQSTSHRVRVRFATVLATARPRQWVKNLLVFGAPATGGVLLEPAPLTAAVQTFVGFCLVSSGVYFINDIVDAPTDRKHATKRFRPIASGKLSARPAAVGGAGLILAGTAVGLAGGRWAVGGVLVSYVGLTLAYTFILQKIALLDIAAIAGGFLLRAVAGGVATDVALSDWFLIVAAFASLFLAAGKRHVEYVRLGTERINYRASLGQYSESYLRYIQYSASTIAIAAYTQWAFEGAAGRTIWSGLSIVPFVLAIFRYGLLLEKGRGAEPEEAILTDPPLLMLGCSWVLLVAIGVYVE